MIAFLSLLLAAAPQIVAADGRWAALRDGLSCQASSLALLPATKTRAQGQAAIAFDNDPRRRNGELALRLSRPVAPGASVMLTIGDAPFLLVARGDMAWSRGPSQEAAIIAAMRRGGGMLASARTASGQRIADRYDLSGAPTAIDAAAACAQAR